IVAPLLVNQNGIAFMDATGNEGVGIYAPASLAASYAMLLPETSPVEGQVLGMGASTQLSGVWPRLPDMGATFDGGGSVLSVGAIERRPVFDACEILEASVLM